MCGRKDELGLLGTKIGRESTPVSPHLGFQLPFERSGWYRPRELAWGQGWGQSWMEGLLQPGRRVQRDRQPHVGCMRGSQSKAEGAAPLSSFSSRHPSTFLSPSYPQQPSTPQESCRAKAFHRAESSRVESDGQEGEGQPPTPEGRPEALSGFLPPASMTAGHFVSLLSSSAFLSDIFP